MSVRVMVIVHISVRTLPRSKKKKEVKTAMKVISSDSESYVMKTKLLLLLLRLSWLT